MKVNLKKINFKLVEEICDLIKSGKVIICPTDTVYGLVCDATNIRAVKKIFKIKKRPKDKPISIFAKNLKMAKDFAIIHASGERLLKNNKITAIFEIKNQAKNLFPRGLARQGDKIAIRIPKYELIREIFKKISFPLSGTSANISGKPDSTRIRDILNQFRRNKFLPDLVLDAGSLKPSEPSKVVDSTGKKPEILRR